MDQKAFLEIERNFHDSYAKTLDWNEGVSEFMSYGKGKLPPVEIHFRQLLGDVNGKRILDIGSGHGNCALNLAKRGAIVTSIDISPELIDGCKRRAANNGLSVDFRVMNACELQFSEETFDSIVGFRTAHHLPDLKQFCLEAYRVLKKGGFIILVEPQKYNPFVEFGRRFIRNKETDRTPTEHPLVSKDIHLLKNIFGNLEKKEFHFLDVSSEFFKVIINLPLVYCISTRLLKFFDDVLWHIPFLRPLYWDVVLKATKKQTKRPLNLGQGE